MKILLKCYLSSMALIGCLNAASVTIDINKNQSLSKFYAYTPGDSNSYHIYFPGDVVVYKGQKFENIKAMNNSHLPVESNMLGSYWQKISPISDKS